MPWTPPPGESGITIAQAAILDLNDLLRGVREELEREHYARFLEIALCRLTGEWRLLLDQGHEDDPRREAA